MTDLGGFNISFSFAPVYFVLAMVLAVLYSVYVYKYTIPKVSTPFRVFLVSLRSAAIILIILAIFEPVVRKVNEYTEDPLSLLFVDNSSSVTAADSAGRAQKIKEVVSELASSVPESRIVLFGNKNSPVSRDSLSFVNFNQSSTDFSLLTEYLEKTEKNVASVTVISDGIMNKGSDPIYYAERAGFPFFTVTVGDTSARKDIGIKKVLYNDRIYAERSTEIEAIILNDGYAGEKVSVTLESTGDGPVNKNIVLNDNGINRVRFEYRPETPGEKKLSLNITRLDGEMTGENNRKIFFINVLDNRSKVVVLSGSPSADVSYITASLKTDPNLDVDVVAQITGDKFTVEEPVTKIDSADIIYMTGFPGDKTQRDFVNEVTDIIKNKSIPFFILVSSETDITALGEMEELLPFSIRSAAQSYGMVTPVISKPGAALLNTGDDSESWDGLPPVYAGRSEISAKPGSDVLLTASGNGFDPERPLLITGSTGTRSIAFLAGNIWRWRSRQNGAGFFDGFFSTTVRWLNTSDRDKQVTLETTERLYGRNEPVSFMGRVYNESMEPVVNAEFEVTLTNGDESGEITLYSSDNGIYEGEYTPRQPGDYTFTGSAAAENITFGSDTGRFTVGEADLEKSDLRADYSYMKLLASRTGGTGYFADNTTGLEQEVITAAEAGREVITETAEFRLWSSEWLLAIIIILFALEWFFRKRAGMI